MHESPNTACTTTSPTPSPTHPKRNACWNTWQAYTLPTDAVQRRHQGSITSGFPAVYSSFFRYFLPGFVHTFGCLPQSEPRLSANAGERGSFQDRGFLQLRPSIKLTALGNRGCGTGAWKWTFPTNSAFYRSVRVCVCVWCGCACPSRVRIFTPSGQLCNPKWSMKRNISRQTMEAIKHYGRCWLGSINQSGK